MAVKNVKQSVEPITQPEAITQEPIADDFDLESAIADELLISVDWAKVRAALIRKAPAKLFAWLTSGNDTPVNISAFPELAALPSHDDEDRAA
ncbi:MAG: hypothetical protein ACKPCM_16010 [Pseudanabaena sp.]